MSEENYILAEADYISGMKYKDIAEKYRVSINTVKSWKKRYAWSRDKKGCTQKGCTQNKKGAHKKEAVAEDVQQVVNNDQLTDQQVLFCLYQSRMFNYTKAYMKAYPRCTYASAAVLGSRLMKNPAIQEEIQQLKQNQLNRTMLKQEDIFQKYMDIAFADVTDYVSFGKKRVNVVNKDGSEEEIEINYVDFEESDRVDGTLITEVSKGKDGIKVKLADRMKAMQWLSDHMDMATNEQKETINAFLTATRPTDEELKNMFEGECEEDGEEEKEI